MKCVGTNNICYCGKLGFTLFFVRFLWFLVQARHHLVSSGLLKIVCDFSEVFRSNLNETEISQDYSSSFSRLVPLKRELF